MTKNDLPDLLADTLKQIGGSGAILEVCKKFWELHEDQLKESGDLLYSWQYDIRWAANALRQQNRLVSAKQSDKKVWTLR